MGNKTGKALQKAIDNLDGRKGNSSPNEIREIISPKQKVRRKLLVVGENSHGEFGLNHTDTLTKLTKIKLTKDITDMYSGRRFTVYVDEKNSNYYISGQYNIINMNSWCGKDLLQLTPIDYFNKENNPNIKVRKICVNVFTDTIVWITLHRILGYDRCIVYGFGKCQSSSQLGRRETPSNVMGQTCAPLIQFFEDKNVIDVQTSNNYSIAIIGPPFDVKSIINHWFKSNEIIPDEIMNMMLLFYYINEVYATDQIYHCGTGHTLQQNGARSKFGWKQIECLKDKHIVSIATGEHHSLFLHQNGNLWTCGWNDNGQLGIENDMTNWYKTHTTKVSVPTSIEYFRKYNIKIKQIKCGANHNIVISYKNKVYSWGCNIDGQLGHGTHGNQTKFNVPKRIEYFDEFEIDIIDCGGTHSYCKTKSNEHYLFGDNNVNQCITNDNRKIVELPHCINEIVQKESNGSGIHKVSLGWCNTKIILME